MMTSICTMAQRWGRRRTIRTAACLQALALISGLMASAGQARAEGGEEAFGTRNAPAARMVVQFEGGVLGTAMAEVVDKLTALDKGKVPIKPEILVVGNDTCGVLAQELAVPIDACSAELVRAVNAFSKKHGRKSNETDPGVRELYLPAIRPRLSTFSRVFDTSKEEDRRKLEEVSNQSEWTKIFLGETIVKPEGKEQVNVNTRAVQNQETRRKQDIQPRTMDALVRPFAYRKKISPPSGVGAVHRLTFESYRWSLDFKDKALVPDLSEIAFDLSNPNRSVVVDLPPEERRGKIRRYATSPSQLFERCSINSGEKPQKAFYTAYLPGSSYAEKAKRCTPGTEPPQIFVLDTKIAPHPDLRQSLRIVSSDDTEKCKLTVPEFPAQPDAASGPSCQARGQYDVDRHHGTYLSGILASSGETTGVVGVAANAKLNSFVWENEIAISEKAELLSDCSDIDKPKIFLFAASFEPVPLRAEYLNATKTELTDLHKDKRWNLSPLNRPIRSNKLLFVVAAGQSDDPARGGEELRRKGLLVPQTLGDVDNVIVVTACEGDCNADQVRVWKNGNYSNDIDQVVHLMAPGGEMIPSFITENQMAQAAGTSASSAFVAGVAANMMACHPSHYATFRRVKEQLLLTARPNLASEDDGKVAAGTVDPELALVDPTASWLKVDGREDMTEIVPQHWCDSSVHIANPDGSDARIDSRRIRRITRLDSTGGYVVKQLVYDDVKEYAGNPARWVMNMDGPGRLDDGPLLAVKVKGRNESCAIKAAGTQDVILSDVVKTTRSCAAIKSCDQVQ